MGEAINQSNHEVTAEQFPELLSAAETIAHFEDSEVTERLDTLPDGRMIYTRTGRVAGRLAHRSYLLHQFDETATRVWQRYDGTPGVVSSLFVHVARQAHAAAERLLAEHPVEKTDVCDIGQLSIRHTFDTRLSESQAADSSSEVQKTT